MHIVSYFFHRLCLFFPQLKSQKSEFTSHVLTSLSLLYTILQLVILYYEYLMNCLIDILVTYLC